MYFFRRENTLYIAVFLDSQIDRKVDPHKNRLDTVPLSVWETRF